MFWYNKELSWNERILQMVKNQTNTFVKLMQAFILSHTIEIDSIMVKNPTRVKFNIELINSNQQPCAKARPLPYNLITSP